MSGGFLYLLILVTIPLFSWWDRYFFWFSVAEHNFKLPNNKRIKFNICEKLFLMTFGRCCKKCCSSYIRDSMEVLDRANDKWEEEIDMSKMIQKMRWMERILKMALPKDKLKMSKKFYYNVIDLDSDPEDSSDSSDNNQK